MIVSRLRFVAIAVISSLASAACQAEFLPCGDTQSGDFGAHENARPESVRPEAGDDLMRMRLLMADAVQDDLGVTAEQMEEIGRFVEFSRDRTRELAAYWPDLSVDATRELSEARKRELQKWMADSQSRQKELVSRIIGALTPIQRERLKQIQLQQVMASTLIKPDFIKGLDITEEQLEKIRTLSDRISEERSAKVHKLDGLTVAERQQKFIELTKERDRAQAHANRLALNVLKPAQRVKLEELVGKIIEVNWDYDAYAAGNGG